MTAHETQDSVPSQDKMSPILGQIFTAWVMQQEIFEGPQFQALCRLAAKWFCVISGRTFCYRLGRWQSAPTARAQNTKR